MKTITQILEYAGGPNCNATDGRDKKRLCDFLPISDWEKMGMKPAAGFDPGQHTPEALTEENVLAHLKKDLDFAFVKALGQRGISSSLMYDVIKMWLWILDDPLADFEGYAEYGLPLLVLVARKYNLPNPLGDDQGNEKKYSAEGGE
jgi:hypothetical protein